MDGIVVNKVPLILGFTILVVICVSLTKPLLKNKKHFLILLPLLFSIPLAFIMTYVESKFVKFSITPYFVNSFFENSFALCFGAIASYDLILEKLKKMVEKMQRDEDKSDDKSREDKKDE